MKKRRQNMDVNIKSLSRQVFSKTKRDTFYPIALFCLLESAPLFHWHPTKNMHSSPILHFFTHTHFSLVITLSTVNAGFQSC